MRKILLRKFGGVTPKSGDNQPVDYRSGYAGAVTATNVDIEDGKLSGMKEDSVVEAAASANSLVEFEDNWYYGQDRNFVKTKSGGADMLLYVQGGTVYKRIGSDVATVGQPRPQEPGTSTSSTGGALDDGTYDLVITTVRNVGGLFYGNNLIADSEDDWKPTGSGGYNVSESNVDYTPSPPSAGDVVIEADTTTQTTTAHADPESDNYNTYDSGTYTDISDSSDSTSLRLANDWTVKSTYTAEFLGDTSMGAIIAEIPTNADIKEVNVIIRSAITGSYDSATSWAEIRVNTTWGLDAGATPPGAVSNQTRTFSTNPDTGLPWTPADLLDINGIGVKMTGVEDFGSWDFYCYELHLEVVYYDFKTSGNIIVQFDMGQQAIGGEDIVFYAEDTEPGGTSLAYTVEAAVTDSWPGASLGTFTDGQTVDASPATYRYFRITSTFAGTTSATPVLDKVELLQFAEEGLHQDESGPSDVESLTIVGGTSTQTITLTPDAEDLARDYVIYWRIYQNVGGTYLFIHQATAATSSYIVTGNETPEEEIPTWFTSDQGNVIMFDQAPAQVTGLITDLHGGMLFAYDGTNIRWTEPGLIDAWPLWYGTEARSSVIGLSPIAGAVSLLTSSGPFRIDGTHPELLQMVKSLSNEPALGPFTESRNGIFYVSDSGVAKFNTVDVDIVSEGQYSEEDFSGLISNIGTAVMEENDGMVYTSYLGNTIVADARSSPYRWKNIGTTYAALWSKSESGEIYGIVGTNIVKLFGSSSSRSWTWRSGDILVEDSGRRHVFYLDVSGSGTVVAAIYVDGVQAATKALDFTTSSGKRLNVPTNTFGRAVQVEVTGTGTVTEISVAYS